MQHQEQVRTMSCCLSGWIQTRMSTPVMRCVNDSAYTCPDRAKAEWDQMFQSFPQVMGLSGDLLSGAHF